MGRASRSSLAFLMALAAMAAPAPARTARAAPPPPEIPCPADGTLTLRGRYQLTFTYRNQYVTPAQEGCGHAVPITGQTGYFWFLESTQASLVVKAFSPSETPNGKTWLSYASLESIEYWLAVRDTVGGGVTSYYSAPGVQSVKFDPDVFGGTAPPPDAPLAEPLAAGTTPVEPAAPDAPCVASETTLCLKGGRYRLTTRVRNQYVTPVVETVGKAVKFSDGSGFFKLIDFQPDNVGVVVKAFLPSETPNQKAWLTFGSLETVEFWVVIEDLTTGLRKEFRSLPGVQTVAFSSDVFASDGCPALSLLPSRSDYEAILNEPFGPLTFEASGGTAPYTYSRSDGLLPAGVTLTSGGVLQGTPTMTGTFFFTVRAIDAAGCSVERGYSLVVAGGGCSLEVLPAVTDLAGVVGTPLPTTVFTGANGTLPYQVASTLLSSPLAGVTLSPDRISGTPQAPGTLRFRIDVSDAAGCAASRIVTLTVTQPACPTITVTAPPPALPVGTVGSPYSQGSPFTASGATGPYTYAVASGTLPAGLSVDGDLLKGTPTQSGVFPFSLVATDVATGCASSPKGYSLQVNACVPIGIGPSTLPGGVIGTPYQQTLTPSGPVFSSSDLPGWLSLSAAGVLSGTPTAAGSYPFTVTANQSGCLGTKAYTITVTQPSADLTILSVTQSPDVMPSSAGGTLSVQLKNQSAAATQGNVDVTLTLNVVQAAAKLGYKDLQTAGWETVFPTTQGSTTIVLRRTAPLAGGATATVVVGVGVFGGSQIGGPFPNNTALVSYGADPVAGNNQQTFNIDMDPN